MSEKIAVYGSLRKGEYNYDRFGGEKSFAYRGSYRLHGYRMFSLGAYPAVIEDDDGEGSILVDILETPTSIAMQIHNMEVGASYHKKFITIDKDTEATIYIYNGAVNKKDELTHGDWKRR